MRLLFLPGSKIDSQVYSSFLYKISTQSQEKNLSSFPITFEQYFPFPNLREPTIIISHSFGGFYALLNALRDPVNVKGCVLINSHFNQRMKMPYFTVPMGKVEIPTLTILSSEDKSLPFDKAMDDIFVKFEEDLKNHHFIVNTGTHLSSFENPKESEVVSKQVIKFIESVCNNDFLFYEKMDENLRNKLYWNFENTETISSYHKFLLSRPYYKNTLYNDVSNSYYKTKGVDQITTIKQEIEKEFGINVKIRENTYKIVKNLPEWKVFSQFPYFFSKWYFYKPDYGYENDLLDLEILTIPIRDDIVYYKFPSKYAIWKKIHNKNDDFDFEFDINFDVCK